MTEYIHIIDAISLLVEKHQEKISKLEQLGKKGMILTAKQKEMKMIYDSGVFLFPQIPEYS